MRSPRRPSPFSPAVTPAPPPLLISLCLSAQLNTAQYVFHPLRSGLRSDLAAKLRNLLSESTTQTCTTARPALLRPKVRRGRYSRHRVLLFAAITVISRGEAFHKVPVRRAGDLLTRRSFADEAAPLNSHLPRGRSAGRRKGAAPATSGPGIKFPKESARPSRDYARSDL